MIRPWSNTDLAAVVGASLAAHIFMRLTGITPGSPVYHVVAFPTVFLAVTVKRYLLRQFPFERHDPWDKDTW